MLVQAARARKALVELDGVSALAPLLDSPVTEVVVSATGALFNTALGVAGADRIRAQAGLIPTLLGAGGIAHADARVRANAAGVLQNVAAHSDASREQLASEGALGALLALTARETDAGAEGDINVIARSVGALSNLALLESNARALCAPPPGAGGGASAGEEGGAAEGFVVVGAEGAMQGGLGPLLEVLGSVQREDVLEDASLSLVRILTVEVASRFELVQLGGLEGVRKLMAAADEELQASRALRCAVRPCCGCWRSSRSGRCRCRALEPELTWSSSPSLRRVRRPAPLPCPFFPVADPRLPAARALRGLGRARAHVRSRGRHRPPSRRAARLRVRGGAGGGRAHNDCSVREARLREGLPQGGRDRGARRAARLARRRLARRLPVRAQRRPQAETLDCCCRALRRVKPASASALLLGALLRLCLTPKPSPLALRPPRADADPSTPSRAHSYCLGQLARTDGPSRARIRDESGLEPTARLLTHGSQAIAAAAAHVLRYAALNEEVKSGVREAGALPTLCLLLTAGEHDVRLTTAALGALANLILNEPESAAIVRRAGGYERALPLLASPTPELQLLAARLFERGLAGSPDNRTHCRTIGALRALVANLGCEDDLTRLSIVGALAHAAHLEPPNQVRLRELGAAAGLVALLQVGPRADGLTADGAQAPNGGQHGGYGKSQALGGSLGGSLGGTAAAAAIAAKSEEEESGNGGRFFSDPIALDFELKRRACWALSHIACEPLGAAAVREAGGLAIILGLLHSPAPRDAEGNGTHAAAAPDSAGANADDASAAMVAAPSTATKDVMGGRAEPPAGLVAAGTSCLFNCAMNDGPGSGPGLLAAGAVGFSLGTLEAARERGDVDTAAYAAGRATLPLLPRKAGLLACSRASWVQYSHACAFGGCKKPLGCSVRCSCMRAGCLECASPFFACLHAFASAGLKHSRLTCAFTPAPFPPARPQAF